MVTRAGLYLRHLQTLEASSDSLAKRIFETTKQLIRGEAHSDLSEVRIELDSIAKNVLEEDFEKEFVSHVRRYTSIVNLKDEPDS